MNIHKRNIATNARKTLIDKFNEANTAPIPDEYIYEHIDWMMI
jgi:hypothetical protein